MASCGSDGKAAVFMCLVQGNYSDNGSLRSQGTTPGNSSLGSGKNVPVISNLFISCHLVSDLVFFTEHTMYRYKQTDTSCVLLVVVV